VFHYHLHVVYVPVVDKEIYFKKNNKDPELAGKLREVIKQVSHSKKWPKLKQLDDNGEVIRNAKGKAVLVNAYSILQDHFYEHMTEAGFTGFERGERGSTAEHLNVLRFKCKQERERAAAAVAVVEQKQGEAAVLDKQIEKKEARIDRLDEQLAVKEKAKATIAEVEKMGSLTLLGNFSLSADELTKLKTMAKKSIGADEKIREANTKRRAAEAAQKTAEDKVKEIDRQAAAAKKAQPSISENLNWFNKFMAALKRAPKRLMAVIEDILRNPPEQAAPERNAPDRRRDTERGLHYVD
jgi:hypothetical protein